MIIKKKGKKKARGSTSVRLRKLMVESDFHWSCVFLNEAPYSSTPIRPRCWSHRRLHRLHQYRRHVFSLYCIQFLSLTLCNIICNMHIYVVSIYTNHYYFPLKAWLWIRQSFCSSTAVVGTSRGEASPTGRTTAGEGTTSPETRISSPFGRLTWAIDMVRAEVLPTVEVFSLDLTVQGRLDRLNIFKTSRFGRRWRIFRTNTFVVLRRSFRIKLGGRLRSCGPGLQIIGIGSMLKRHDPLLLVLSFSQVFGGYLC